MIDGSEKRYRQLAFELQNSHVYEKRSKSYLYNINNNINNNINLTELKRIWPVWVIVSGDSPEIIPSPVLQIKINPYLT